MTVITEPASVWIEHEGERLAEGTPVTLEGLPAGTLELTLGTDEFRSIQVTVDVPKDGVGMLERTLEPTPYGTLTLELEPPDATVTLPDIASAYRPGMRIPEERHRVIVARRGFRQVTQTVEVEGDTRKRIELAIDPQPFTVAAMPDDAEVRLMSVDDDYRDGIPLKPGEYRIRVSAPEYETLEEKITHGVEPTLYRVELARSPQPFTVVAMPADAVVDVVDLSEDYVSGIRLPPGDYRIRVSAEGYETWERSVRHATEPTRVEVELERSLPQPGETFVDALVSGGKGPEMVVVPTGSFRMGCLSFDDACYDNETPVHDVGIPQPIALSKYEVTRREFSRFVRSTGYSAAVSCWVYQEARWVYGFSGWKELTDRSWRSPPFEQTDSHPVACVNWEDAKAYLAWLSREAGVQYRLPSESEWEYAARSGAITKYSWGNQVGHNRANCRGCGSQWDDDRTAPVGSFAPNAFGLHDMHGNIWELVEDCWNGSYAGAPVDGSAWTEGHCYTRVARGGSWRNGPRNLRSTNRLWRRTMSVRYYDVGFRVARTLDP